MCWKLGAGSVSLRRRPSTPNLAIVVEPCDEDLKIVVVHRAVGPDELLERRADLVLELSGGPILHPPGHRIVKS
jgi:hypothetical protein